MIIWTIKELYEWAVKEGIEEYDLFICNEGELINCNTDEMYISECEIWI